MATVTLWTGERAVYSASLDQCKHVARQIAKSNGEPKTFTIRHAGADFLVCFYEPGKRMKWLDANHYK